LNNPRQTPQSIQASIWRKCRYLGINFLIPILLGIIGAHLAHRHVYPPTVAELAPDGSSYGAVRVRFQLPGTSGGIPEPLLTVGDKQKASIVYIRLLNHARAKVGVQFLGLPPVEGDEFSLPAMDAQIEVKFFLPGLFAAVGDPSWGGTSASLQGIRKGRFYILVNNVVREKGLIDYPQPAHPRIYVGENPVGGGYVTGGFSGTFLAASQAR
jgi:hypothetical protein